MIKVFALSLLAGFAALFAGCSSQDERTAESSPEPSDAVAVQAAEPLEITVESRFGFEETIEKLKEAAAAEKFGVQGLHEISKILTEKGYPREPLAVLEVCHPGHASVALEQDINIALMIPCPISIYEKDGKVFVSTFNTKKMATMYKGEKMPEVAAAVDEAMRKILQAISVEEA